MESDNIFQHHATQSLQRSLSLDNGIDQGKYLTFTLNDEKFCVEIRLVKELL